MRQRKRMWEIGDPLRRQRLRVRQMTFPPFKLRPSEFRLGWPLFFGCKTMLQTVVLSADATLFALMALKSLRKIQTEPDPAYLTPARFTILTFFALFLALFFPKF